MAKNWSENVNSNFYGVTYTVKENVKKLEFESGKTRTYLLNSEPKKSFSVNLVLWDSTEEANFWSWYNNTILSGSLSFMLPDLLGGENNKEYEITDVPSVEGQSPKKLTMTLQEV